MAGADDLLVITPTERGVTLAGEIDAHTAPALAEAIHGIDGDVEIEMSGVEFVDSSGLRVLIDAHQHVDERGDHLRLVNLSDAVRRLLEISGVDDYLNVG